jgi:hypothetical protein
VDEQSLRAIGEVSAVVDGDRAGTVVVGAERSGLPTGGWWTMAVAWSAA